ncbi:hypothetical protein, partial [Flavobacterium ranwuense]|uniref:hypothetical protein n=1 Tax=Flavobacterium ranwuense TaxID=2541725 RepID=UPI00197A8E87
GATRGLGLKMRVFSVKHKFSKYKPFHRVPKTKSKKTTIFTSKIQHNNGNCLSFNLIKNGIPIPENLKQETDH